jgi:trehalose 6-phosphate phosphatase
VVGPVRGLREPPAVTRARDVVDAFVARARHAGALLDVDGTLAPIVARPELARVLPEIPAVLADIARHVRVVAVISGRPSAEVRDLVAIDGIEIVGTHGLEGEAPMPPEVLGEIVRAADSVGAWVEPKGAAAAVHFRGLADPEAAGAAAAGRLAVVAAANDLEVVPGKHILELMPAGRPRKGGAVERLVREHELDAVLFAGDDVGDLDAFAALVRLRARGMWTCGVVAGGPETLPEVEAAADLVVEGPAGVAALLAAIADRLG